MENSFICYHLKENEHKSAYKRYGEFYSNMSSFEKGSIIPYGETFPENKSTSVVFSNHDLKANVDCWGTYPLYYFYSDKLFAISDNLYCLKRFVESRSIKIYANRETYYEYLFYGIPLGSNTWFKDIFVLKPGQCLCYNSIDKTVKLSEGGGYYPNVLDGSITDSFNTFFVQLKELGQEVALSISHGSDSRTLLAGLRFHKIPHKLYCFGKDEYAEIKNTTKLMESIHEPVNYVKLSSDREEYFRMLGQAILDSNGLINPLRIHYLDYYRKLPKDSLLMEGILGSEFIKGEISYPTMTSFPVMDVLFNRKSIENVISERFPYLNTEEQAEMIKLIKQNGLWIHNDKKEMKNKYAKYLFSNLPSKVFGGIINIASSRHQLLHPYINTLILNTVFQKGFGIMSYSSFYDDFPGAIRCLQPEALAVREWDKELYKSVLDRGVSLSESFSPFAPLLKKRRSFINRFCNDPSLFYGQIDNSDVKRWILQEAHNNGIVSSKMSDDSIIVNWYYNQTITTS